eukprot:6189620-Pleurochrysis_carterae.AAC.1
MPLCTPMQRKSACKQGERCNSIPNRPLSGWGRTPKYRENPGHQTRRTLHETARRFDSFERSSASCVRIRLDRTAATRLIRLLDKQHTDSYSCKDSESRLSKVDAFCDSCWH